MSKVTLASLTSDVNALTFNNGKLQGQLDMASKNFNTLVGDLEVQAKEVLRLRLLASEMRGFIMAHHATEHPLGGQTLYKEPYGSDEDNIVELPLLRYPFMDEKLTN